MLRAIRVVETIDCPRLTGAAGGNQIGVSEAIFYFRRDFKRVKRLPGFKQPFDAHCAIAHATHDVRQRIHRRQHTQRLAPRRIQSMEILQLPLMALEERIEQEIQNNPVLEQREGDGESENGNQSATEGAPDVQQDSSEGEQALVVKENDDAEDFERLAKISDYLENEIGRAH